MENKLTMKSSRKINYLITNLKWPLPTPTYTCSHGKNMA